MMAQGATKIAETVYLSFMSDVSPTSAEGLAHACTKLSNEGAKTLYLIMNTPGGSVAHGIALYNLLRALPCRIITHNVGAIDSIGNVIFLAGEERYANPGTSFMFHGVSKPVQNGILDERRLKEGLEAVRGDQIKIANIIRDRCSGFKEGEIERFFYEADIMSAENAKERGIISEIRPAEIAPGCPVHQLVFAR